MKKVFKLKDIYRATIYKVSKLTVNYPYGLLTPDGNAKLKSEKCRFVYKEKDKYIDCLTGIEYPLFQKLKITNIYQNMLVVYNGYIHPFYEAYPMAPKLLIENGKDPQKMTIDLKTLLQFQEELDRFFLASLKEEKKQEEKQENNEITM